MHKQFTDSASNNIPACCIKASWSVDAFLPIISIKNSFRITITVYLILLSEHTGNAHYATRKRFRKTDLFRF